MKRRLWLLNIALAAVLVLLGHVLRDRWQEAQARQDKILQTKIRPAPPPSMPPQPAVRKLEPTSYAEVAMKVLFARDRNPEVIPDPPKPPPPPPPVPPFPLAHGVMIWGGVPPTIILSVGKGEQQAYRAGDKVGEFEIASIDERQIVFTWDGKTFVKNISDLEAPASAAPAAAAQQAANTPPPAAGSPVQAVAPRIGPGENSTADGKTRMCDPSDPSPMGAIVDGYRKIPVVSPIAPNAHFCQWQLVN